MWLITLLVVELVRLDSGLDDITISGNIQSQWVFPLTGVAGPGLGFTKINYDQKSLTYNVSQWTDYFLGFIPVSFQMQFKMIQQLYVNRLDIYMHKGDSSPPTLTVNYDYDMEYRDHDQFIVAKTIESDSHKKTIYYYGSTTKKYIRYLDFSDYAADIANNLIISLKNSGANIFSIINGLYVDDPYAYNVVPYNTEEDIYDAQTGLLLEKTTYQYDLNLMRPTQQTTYHGSNYHQLSYTYDNWANITFANDYSISGGRVNQTKTWMYYLGTNSSPSTDVSWPASPFSQTSLTQDRHDLLIGKIVANYIPNISGTATVNYLQSYNQYNGLSQLTGNAQRSGNEWLTTQYEYHPTFGSLTKKTNPEGHVTVYDYDTNGFPSAITRKISQGCGNTHN